MTPLRFIAVVFLLTSPVWSQQYQYPFQDPTLPMEVRIDNILSLMTFEEKISALSTSPDVPRLGIHGSGHIEGLHGAAYGGPGGWKAAAFSPWRPHSFPKRWAWVKLGIPICSVKLPPSKATKRATSSRARIYLPSAVEANTGVAKVL